MMLAIVVSHPFAQNAKEWGTQGFVTDEKGGPPAPVQTRIPDHLVGHPAFPARIYSRYSLRSLAGGGYGN